MEVVFSYGIRGKGKFSFRSCLVDRIRCDSPKNWYDARWVTSEMFQLRNISCILLGLLNRPEGCFTPFISIFSSVCAINFICYNFFSAIKYKGSKFILSQTMLRLTKFIEKNINIYHIKKVYYKDASQNVSN